MIDWLLGRPESLLTGASTLLASDLEYCCSERVPSSPVLPFGRQVVTDVQYLSDSTASPTTSPIILLPLDICDRSLRLRRLCTVTVFIKLRNDLSLTHIPQQLMSNILLYDLRNGISQLQDSRQLTTLVSFNFTMHQVTLTLRGSPALVSSCIDSLNLQVRNESSILRKGVLSSTMSLLGANLIEEENNFRLLTSIRRRDIQVVILGIFILFVAIIFRRRFYVCSVFVFPEAFRSIWLLRAGIPRRNN